MSWRARLRRVRFLGVAFVCGIVILLGVLAGLTQLAMPWLTHHPQYVEHWLSARLGRTVAIGEVRGRWIGGGPVLTLTNVRIDSPAAAQPPFAVPRAELAFDLSALFRRNRAVSEFRVSGLDLRIVHGEDGWRVQGMDANGGGDSDEPFSMGALGAIEISDLKLGIDDASRNLHLALAVPVLRLLNRGDVTRAVGRFRQIDSDSPPLELVADFDARDRSGQLYLGARDVDLARALAGQAPGGVQVGAGRGDLQLWARIAAAQPYDVRLRVALRDTQFVATQAIALDERTSIAPRVAFDRLGFVARWLREDSGWTLDVADFLADRGGTNPPARLALEQRTADDGPHYRAGASALPLDAIGNLAMLAQALPEGTRRWLYLAHPRGTLASASFAWQGAGDYDLAASLRGVALADAGAVPGIDPIDLDVHGDAQSILLELREQAMRIDYPKIFRKPFVFSRFGGDVVVRRTDEGWRLETERVGFEGEGYGGEVRGGVDLRDGHKPALDLYAIVTHAEVPAAKLFWPTVTMPPKAIAYLDRALVAGHLVEGRVAIRGELDAWPFHDRSGLMIARGEVNDLTFDYDPAWPRAENVHAQIAFVNDGVHLEADAGEALGNRIVQASATIEDFGPLILELSAKGEGSGANLLAFLRATPVGNHYQEQLKDLDIAGKGAVDFTLNLPIKDKDALALEGGVSLVDSKLDHNAYDLHFTGASGRVRFSQKGFAADALDVTFRSRKAKLGVSVGGFVGDARHAFEARLGGRFPLTSVFADVPVLLPAFAKTPGESEWKVGLDIDAAANGEGRKRLFLESDLRGTAIDLPAPLAKSADAALPFRLDLDVPFIGQTFVATLAGVATMQGRLPTPIKPFAARVEFGAGPAGEPPAQGVAIGGKAATLDASGWVDLATGQGGSGGDLLRGIDVHAVDFLFGGRHFDDVRVALDPGPAGTTIRLDSAAVAGTLNLPGGNLASAGITAKFARIHWPESSADTDEADALPAVAPGSLPPLHLSVDDFRLGSASFGLTEFESVPDAGGMRIDRFSARSPNLDMKASGEWTGDAKNNRSRLTIELTAQSLGHMMEALGFPGLIDGGSTRATIAASWAGPPSAFALAKLDGTLDIDVAEGRILDVEPGAGRIFGLLSLTEIPRRLSLDFTDFFKSGFSFNSIVGKFRVADGNAYTDGLTIKSPAADIVVTGRTGLRAKDYDQQMRVSAHAGATIPLVGALAAGPVGAAAGLVVQGILNKPLGKAIERRYQVSGGWDKPKITPVERSNPRSRAPAKGAAADAPAEGGALR